MRQARKKKEKDKIAVALMLAFCVIALTSIFTIKSNIEKVSGSNQDIIVSENTAADQAGSISENHSRPESDAAKDTAGADDPASQVSSDIPIVESEAPAQSGKAGFINPVRADNSFIASEFSMDSLVYSVTLDQYMTHQGVDIEAPADSQVVACGDGTVTGIYEDGRYGICIEITHPDGFTTIYSNLSTDDMVEIGDDVTAGSIISGVGATGLFESMQPPHLHLEMLKDGVYVNPADYIKF